MSLSEASIKAISDRDSIFDQIDAIREKFCAKTVARPPNSITVRQYADRYRMSESHARNVLADLVKKGALVKIRAYVVDSTGRPMPTNCYTVVNDTRRT